MKTKITFAFMGAITLIILIFITHKKTSHNKTLRQQHSAFLMEHPFNNLLKLSKEERKSMGLPPNKYFEEQYLLEINPALGRPEYEKKIALQEKLLKQTFQRGVPGSIDNIWVERGPTNVPGRTRALLFDPNDSTNKRVFAGGVSGGLWVNNDITTSNSPWTRVGIPENLSVSNITVDPNNSMIMYLGTGESYVQGQVNGNGVYKSTNGGTSWVKVFGANQGTAFFNGGSKVTINSPGSIAGDIVAVLAGFGPAFSTVITGNLVLVSDGSGLPTQGCNALTNGAAINGNIAVIERGSCNFTAKVKNAQNQGAIAVLMINNIDGNPITMGGTDTTITIPSVMISKQDGASILTTIQSQTVNASLSDAGNLPSGVTIVPGIFHINDIVTRNNGGTTEIYAAVSDAIYREAPGTLLGNGSEYGLYKSNDAGSTWSKINLPSTANGNPYNPNDIEISSNNTIWLSTTTSSSFGDGGGTIFSSTDPAGTIFNQKHIVPNASRTEIEISATNPNKIYVLANENPVTIIRTTDGFASTSTLTLPNDADNGIPANDFTRGQAFYDLMLEADPNNDDIVYVGGVDAFRSTDGGTTWAQISKWSNNSNLNTLNIPFMHADIHEMSFDPSNPDKAVIATDGGVFYASSLAASNSSTTSIFSSNVNYNTTQFYKGAIGQNGSVDQILGGAQDNGTNFINGGSAGLNASTRISGGDGGFCFIDKDGQYLITSFTANNYTRFNLPNTNTSMTIDNDNSSGSFINPADLDDNLDILYTNGSSSTGVFVARYTNVKSGTPVRRDLANGLLTATPTVLKVSPFTTTSTTLLVGTINGSLLKVTGTEKIFPNPSWSNISGPNFVGSISDITFGANEQEIIVTFHNYGVKSIWFTEDGGTTWQDKEGDFPDIPVKAVKMNPLLNNEVIVGTDLGVWRTDNFKSVNPTWKQSQNGMQNVKVTSFDLRTADNTVLATTYGRGFFTSQFTSTPLGIEDSDLITNSIKVFPTVSHGEFSIMSKNALGNVDMQLYSITGQKVFDTTFELTSLEKNFNLNLNSGLYLMKIKGSNFEGTKRIVIK
jgi:photosystem II stability/assembly factor-like uncharacterized protein